ncbi:hypothetical protein D910_04558 [Dendroctonus ponderosae]|uniref:Uncharacterized protein n=1 Tax=Dendroctonus ponderosae TaxID=77166 RepID=U4U485_DENPD|nr:hypothetical protein D910_04558 [Dendroctonus ponderosae]
MVEESTSLRGFVNLHCDLGLRIFGTGLTVPRSGLPGGLLKVLRFTKLLGEALKSRMVISLDLAAGAFSICCLESFSCSTADIFLFPDKEELFCSSSFLKSNVEVFLEPLRSLQAQLCRVRD